MRKMRHETIHVYFISTSFLMFTFLFFGLSIFLNTEQYSLSSCNMISRAEVKNIIDKLQGVKISLLRMASEAVLTQVFF